VVTILGVQLTDADAAAVLLRRHGDTLDTRGLFAVQISHRSRNALEQGLYTSLRRSDNGSELRCSMVSSAGRARALIGRRMTQSFLGARGLSALRPCGGRLAAGSTLVLRGCMGACVAQALGNGMRLPRLVC
jgi:hypothetical protein